MTDETEALFVTAGDEYVPTDYSRGPWNPENLHGGPIAALLAREAQRFEPSTELEDVRLTVELLRPVSFDPIALRAHVARPGRKVQLIEAVASQRGRDVAKALLLRIRTRHITLPISVPSEPRRFPGPFDISPMDTSGEPRTFHSEGTELRFVEGKFGRPGPATVWIRLRRPVTKGAEPTPLERVAAAADFGNGVGAILPFEGWVFINPDLTVYVNRPAKGPWIALEARMHLQPNGIGLAESRLWDADGPIGRAVQSLFVEPVD